MPHKNWHSISDISLMLDRAVCGSHIQVAPDFRWDFYLNEFLASGIREHGRRALVWATGSLQERAQDSFFFSAPVWLHKDIPEHGTKPGDNELGPHLRTRRPVRDR